MTTLGYGDITPISPYARLVASIEAGIGSLYLAIVVAALVGQLRSESSKAEG
jgi:voltage-gated potassium channel